MEFYKVKPEYRDHLMLMDDTGMRVTYGGFEVFCDTVGKKLEAGTLMMIFCENSIGSVLFYLTCLNHRIVPLLLDKNMDRKLADRLIRIYQPDYIAMSAEDSFESEACTGRTVEAGYGYVVIQCEKEEKTHVHEDLALLLTTSGSTGSPKLVRQSRENICSNAKSIAEYLELDADERPITVLPMNYTYGLSIINSHLEAGAAVLLTERTLFEQEFWSFAKKAGATSISGVPYTYEMLKRLSFFKMDLPALRTMTQAGGKLSEKRHREFAEFAEKTGKKFVVMYGQTEATARMGYLPPEQAIAKCGSMGIAIPGGRFRLMEDEHSEIREAGQVGELVYEGPNVTMGYAECKEDLAKGDELGGILYTGDMAKFDEDGYYYITGRKKRFLKMFGTRVNMDEIEQMIKAEYDGISAACTGEDNRMRIYIECEKEEVCGEMEIRLAEKTGIHPSGIRVFPIGKIPRNESGKILYHALEP